MSDPYKRLRKSARDMQRIENDANSDERPRRRRRRPWRIVLIVVLLLITICLIMAALPYFRIHMILMRYTIASWAAGLIPILLIAVILLIVL